MVPGEEPLHAKRWWDRKKHIARLEGAARGGRGTALAGVGVHMHVMLLTRCVLTG